MTPPWARTAAWTALVLVIGSALMAFSYYLFIASLSGPITYFDVYLWQFLAWAIWVAIAPVVFPVVQRLLLRGHRDWRVWLTLLGIGFAILLVHAVWSGIASAAFSPYPSLEHFPSALGYHLRFGMPIDLAALAALVVFAWRTVASEAMERQKALAEQALERSEQRFRDFFENAIFGIFRSTPDGRFLMLNESAANAIGYDSAEEAMQDVQDIGAQIYVDPAVRAQYLEVMQREGGVANWVWKMRRRDGSIMWNSETARAVFDDDGELLYLEGTAKDITAEVEAREALQESERRSAELRIQLADAELRALKLQIKPHFLFNILNTVAMMIRTGETDKAQQVVNMLGAMFRRFLEFEGEDTVTLEQELGFVDLYLGLEQFRFGDRIALHRDIAAETLGLAVPTLILQPLMENAVKHGLAHMRGVCRLSLSASLDADHLEIQIGNDVDPDRGDDRAAGHGIGLSNTRARLRELYGDRASFELMVDGRHVRSVVRIPLEEAAA